MFWDNEDVLTVTFNKSPKYHDREIKDGDNEIVILDKEGKKTTLDKNKKQYPYKLDNDIICTIVTTERQFSFEIEKDYYWNGADIPRILWLLVGSKDSPEFKVPSLIHDFLLEFKEEIMYSTLKNTISAGQYRRLTSLIFRQLLKDNGTKEIKSNIMSGCVAGWQFVSPQWWGLG